jgi:hypothetical protein
VPDQPAANYSRLARLDSTGLIWLLRGRPVIVLTSTEAAIRCPSGATLTYRRQNKPTPAEIVSGTLAVAQIGKTIVTPAVAEFAKEATP